MIVLISPWSHLSYCWRKRTHWFCASIFFGIKCEGFHVPRSRLWGAFHLGYIAISLRFSTKESEWAGLFHLLLEISQCFQSDGISRLCGGLLFLSSCRARFEALTVMKTSCGLVRKSDQECNKHGFAQIAQASQLTRMYLQQKQRIGRMTVSFGNKAVK